MTANEAKKLVREALVEEKVSYSKLTARTVSFSDLARCSKVFVSVHRANDAPWPEGSFGRVTARLHGTGVFIGDASDIVFREPFDHHLDDYPKSSALY